MQNPNEPIGIEPATFRLVAQFLYFIIYLLNHVFKTNCVDIAQPNTKVIRNLSRKSGGNTSSLCAHVMHSLIEYNAQKHDTSSDRHIITSK